MPLQESGGFVHYHWPVSLQVRITRRARSAPAGPALESARGEREATRRMLHGRRCADAHCGGCAVLRPWDEREERAACRRPQRNSREALDRLGLPELSLIAREYGLRRLRCQEDLQAADGALPLVGRPAAPGWASRVHGFLDRLTWTELINTLQETARRRLHRLRDLRDHSPAGLRELTSWEYFECVCGVLFESRLRGRGPPGSCDAEGNSVMAWRMRRLCTEQGLLSCWEEVLRRLGCGWLLFCTALPMPHLSDELRRVTQMVPHYRVLPGTRADKAVLERSLYGCDVLYVAGGHGREPRGLRLCNVRGLPLAILNMCRTELLARHLLHRGVRYVAYWPAEVHDREAVEFGVEFVRSLFRHSIQEAFSRATACVCRAERPPKLLAWQLQVPRPLIPADAGLVVLERRGHYASGAADFAGKIAQVLSHTALNGWVRVCVGAEVISWRVGHWRVPRGGSRKLPVPWQSGASSRPPRMPATGAAPLHPSLEQVAARPKRPRAGCGGCLPVGDAAFASAALAEERLESPQKQPRRAVPRRPWRGLFWTAYAEGGAEGSSFRITSADSRGRAAGAAAANCSDRCLAAREPPMPAKPLLRRSLAREALGELIWGFTSCGPK